MEIRFILYILQSLNKNANYIEMNRSIVLLFYFLFLSGCWVISHGKFCLFEWPLGSYHNLLGTH